MEADLPQAGGFAAQGPSKFRCALFAATGGMAGIPAVARRASSEQGGARLPIPKNMFCLRPTGLPSRVRQPLILRCDITQSHQIR